MPELPGLPVLQQTDGEKIATSPLNVAQAVRERYSAASQKPADELCCPVNYNAAYLKAIPAEILNRDYGCGDPSKHIRAGEVVLDLGSGSGKICYIAAQVVGEHGRVIGVDANDDMLALARRYQQEVGRRLGFQNVRFHKGRIQDLALDLEVFETYLRAHPVAGSASWLAAEEYAEQLRLTKPMIASDSVDVVVSNCVLNLVARGDRQRLFSEIFRVLKPGGRAVISDITSDRAVPQRLQDNAQLWTGCISGAFVESEFPLAFAAAGFHGMRILERQERPWKTVEGIEFRSVTIEAHKPRLAGADQEMNQAVIYRGPWRSVTDDHGNKLVRGERTTVTDASYERLTQAPYADQVIAVSAQGKANATEPGEANAPGGDCCGENRCC